MQYFSFKIQNGIFIKFTQSLEHITAFVAQVQGLFAFITTRVEGRDVVAFWSRHRAGNRLIPSSNLTCVRNKAAPSWCSRSRLMVKYIINIFFWGLCADWASGWGGGRRDRVGRKVLKTDGLRDK